MKFKIDENLGAEVYDIVRAHYEDTDTVVSEGLMGAKDTLIFETICREGRILLTLDMDFANILRFPPTLSPGLIVFRMVEPHSRSSIKNLVTKFIHFLDTNDPQGKLWIVEPRRVRIHQGSGNE